MAVSDNYEIIDFVGDGVKNVFEFPFRCLNLEDLVLVRVAADGSETVLTDGVDFAIQTSFDNTGGIVVYPLPVGSNPLSTEEVLRIYRESPQTQENTVEDFKHAYKIRDSFDKDMLLIQEVKAKTDLALENIEDIINGEGIKAIAVRPQTIVRGAVGSIPSGWEDGWCDKPAEQIIAPGSSALTIQAGLQVAAGVEGKTVLSMVLVSDTSVDISSALAQESGTFYVYADITPVGSLSFAFTALAPQVGNESVTAGDFYNISTHTHYDQEGNILKRVYLGEFEVVSNAVSKLVNYQHGTMCSLPVNGGQNITLDSIYSENKTYLGEYSTEARIYNDNQWGNPYWQDLYDSKNIYHFIHGTIATPTASGIQVVTGKDHLNSDTQHVGNVFTTAADSAPAKVVSIRQW